MPAFDMPLEQLKKYRPALTRPADFDAFWKKALRESSAEPVEPEFYPVRNYSVREVNVYEARYRGFQGAAIACWFLAPNKPGSLGDPCPCVIFYHGYSGNKGMPNQYLHWAMQGFCVLAVDTRGQSGDADDPGPYAGGHQSGWMTMGIMTPEQYYFRRVYLDCLRALDAVRHRPEVDETRLILTGMSQGGALTLAVAALAGDRAAFAISEMPFLCHFERAIRICGAGPFLELAEYFKKYPDREEKAMKTLAYCDVMNLAPWIKCKSVVTVGLWDDICPPSTVFAAYNHMKCRREIRVFPYHKHEGVMAFAEEKVHLIRRFAEESRGRGGKRSGR